MTSVGDDKPRLPKRFYQDVSIEFGALLLDSRPARTRAGKPLNLPEPAVMAAVAAEWRAQGDHIEFASMPMTRFAMTIIDRGDDDAPTWRADLMAFLKSDLLCYRATEPAALVRRQNDQWDPLLDWASTKHGVSLVSGEGVSFIEQPRESLDAGERRLASVSPPALIGMKTAAEISGSAIIAFALDSGQFAPEQLFDAAHVDETFQAEQWGADREAEQRTLRRRAAFLDAGRFLALLTRAHADLR